MSSRVGTAIPASRSTALSSAAVGFTRSIQTAPSGKTPRSVTAAFFREVSEGTNTENMEDSGQDRPLNQQDLARFWQAFHDRPTRFPAGFAARRWQEGWRGPGGSARSCPRMERRRENLRQKRHNLSLAVRDTHLSTGIIATLPIMLLAES